MTVVAATRISGRYSEHRPQWQPTLLIAIFARITPDERWRMLAR